MAIGIYIESDEGKVKKSSLEAAAVAKKVAEEKGEEVMAFSVGGIDDFSSLGGVGISNAYILKNDALDEENAQGIATGLAQAMNTKSITLLVLSHSSLGEAVSARLAVKVGAGLATNVIGAPDLSNGFMVKRGIYTSKAFTDAEVKGENKIITIKKNSFPFEAGEGEVTTEEMPVDIGEEDQKVKIKETKKAEGDVLLPEAEMVVSAGRGLKGPENWEMVENLAKTLGAATACSKPVSDMEWRPHHEHVGQTGIKISPNLYIAIGISGAIQHLAGVSSSKVIVVINTDPEAPFFKAADYGIVGDAFEVVPKLTEAFKKVL